MAGRREAIAAASVLAVLGAMLALRTVLPIDEAVVFLQEQTLAAGALAPLIYILAFIAAMLLALPATPFTLMAGLLFGPALGIVYAWTGAFVGSAAAYSIARFGRRPVRAFLEGRSARMLHFLDDHSFGAVFVLRVLLLPFGLTSYALGLAGVKQRAFFWGTFLGELPPVVAFVLFGAAFGDLRQLAAPAFAIPLVVATGVTLLGVAATLRRPVPACEVKPGTESMP